MPSGCFGGPRARHRRCFLPSRGGELQVTLSDIRHEAATDLKSRILILKQRLALQEFFSFETCLRFAPERNKTLDIMSSYNVNSKINDIYTYQVRYLNSSSAEGHPSILAAVNQITKHTDWLQRLLVNLQPSLLNKVISTEVHEGVSESHHLIWSPSRNCTTLRDPNKEAFKA